MISSRLDKSQENHELLEKSAQHAHKHPLRHAHHVQHVEHVQHALKGFTFSVSSDEHVEL